MDFHKKHGFPINDGGRLVRVVGSRVLDDFAQIIHSVSSLAFRNWEASRDDRMMRVHLMAEELSEVIEALADADVNALCKELGDLDYVVSGTYVVYGLPQKAIQQRVHLSNMTKKQRDSKDHRLTSREGYVAPDFSDIIKEVEGDE